MKKFLTLLLIVLSLNAFAADLPANQTLIGYTISDDITVKGASFGYAGTYSIGARLSSKMMHYYAGCRIVGIRLASDIDLGRTRTFLMKGSDAAFSEIHSQKQAIYEGWNNVYFNGDGYVIEDGAEYFFGFDYTETDDMVAADIGAICSVGADTEGAFYLYANNEFFQVTGVGKLCVQLIVDVTNLPADNMMISYFDTGFKYKTRGEEIEIFSMITNVGRQKVESYRMAAVFDDNDPLFFDVTPEHGVVSGDYDTWQHIIPMPKGMAVGAHTLTVYVDKANGTTITDRTGAQSVKFAVYANTMPRRQVYMETYTSQEDFYSTYFDELIPDFKVEMADKVAIVQVHAPGTSLHVDGSDYLHGLYAYTYPCFTVNRAYFPGEAYVAYDMNGYFGTLPNAFLIAILCDIVEQDLYSPAFADIELDTEYSPADRTLKIKAYGKTIEEAEAIFGKLALTLMITEDNVKAPQAVLNKFGAITTSSIYRHDNVLRKYISAPLGDVITLDENGDYSMSYSITIPSGWDENKLNVVALVSGALDKVSQSNMLDADITNATSAKVVVPDALADVAVDNEKTVVAIYSIDGIKLAQKPQSGLYIVRYSDGSAKVLRP